MDFFKIVCGKPTNSSPIQIYPVFKVGKTKDLMIRGGDFYAIWDKEKGLWSTDEFDVVDIIDNSIDEFKNKNPEFVGARTLYMVNSDSGIIDKWHKYVQKQMPDDYHPLDEKVIFANTPVNKEDYASRRLPYALEKGDYSAWDELVSILYSPEERHKIEWAIGSIVNGDSKNIQKFFVFYGAPKTGKSTILNIIEKMFDGYTVSFDAKSLGRVSDSFALEPFKNNPLIAIQQDGDLSKIEDNTRLNSIVSHESMLMNEKFKSQYTISFHTILFMGTNKPVKITDLKSGITRRLIDISPTEQIIPRARYDSLLNEINYELGAIAYHCKEVYEEDPRFYDGYVAFSMLGATNDFYNFMEENFEEYAKKDQTTLNEAWLKYKLYCDEAKVPFPYPKRLFKEELKNYFKQFKVRYHRDDSTNVYNWYGGFRIEKFGFEPIPELEETDKSKTEEFKTWLSFNTTVSIFDIVAKDYPAQLATNAGTPRDGWDNVATTLQDIDTSELHYVRLPENHIVVDFDIKGEDGNKSLERNIKAASEFPPTYAELSKSGKGIHLHYIYTGDPKVLSRLYGEDIEVKVYTGKMSLRRKLTRCNDIPIKTISSGLPLKEEVKTVSDYVIKNERHLRSLIEKALRKEIEPYATKTSIDFIDKVLTDAYESGMKFDVTDLRPDILAFAGQSTNNALYCLDKAGNMIYRSDEPSDQIDAESDELVFFDVEVMCNLFVVVAKPRGKSPIKYINPTPEDIRQLCKYRLVGFNNRKYDNHILYGRLMGYDNFELFVLSQNIINGGKENSVRNEYYFREAYNLSYTDVYDFCAKKQGLKKWEIELGIHHQELGLPWDQPVPEDMWEKVAEYCCNDVIATEAVFEARYSDFEARLILVNLANNIVGPGSTPNDTTNTLTTKLIVGNDPHPQDKFVYPDLAKEFPGYEFNKFGIDKSRYISPDVIISGKSIYKGYDPGEGGFVIARHGMYFDAECDDSASHHPSSIIAENGFGPYTENYKMLLDIRLHIKHKEYDVVREMYNGILSPYLVDDKQAKALSNALKIAINSVYGLTAAHFDNKLRDPRNIDNWVAKRGALFMIELMLQVEAKGYKVIHIKTDSIKIEHVDDKIRKFIYDFGKKYGYTFEIEHKFDRLCLVNDSTYICKYTDDPVNGDMAGKWEATGEQFAEPVVFKTLFSHEPIEFSDYCQTQTTSVGLGLYLDMNENLPDVSAEEKELSKIVSKWKKMGYEMTPNNDEQLVKISDKVGSEIYMLNPEEYHADYIRACELDDIIQKGHEYVFIGKAGSFCPVIPGADGGLLVRENKGKFAYASGSKGYRWLESEVIKTLGKENYIDKTYYAALVDKAVDAINKYGDFEMFAE